VAHAIRQGARRRRSQLEYDECLISTTSYGRFSTTRTDDATGLSWELFTHTFIASATTTLAFLNGDPGDDNSNGLDNVVLIDLGPAATPLPAALPLFATGLGALGLLGWRRKRKAAAIAAA
jgi:hypothetical protein